MKIYKVGVSIPASNGKHEYEEIEVRAEVGAEDENECRLCLLDLLNEVGVKTWIEERVEE